MPAGSIPTVELLTGDTTCHHRPHFWPGKEEGFAASVPTAPPSLPGWDRHAPATPPELQGETWVRIKSKNLVQLCRKTPGMAVPPQHRVVPSTELPQSSAAAWFSLGSNAGLGGAGKLPSLVAEIKRIK